MENESTDFETLWQHLQLYIPLLNDELTINQLQETPSKYQDIKSSLQKLEFVKTIQDLVKLKIEERLRCEVTPSFWFYFDESENETEDFRQFYNAVKSLYDDYMVLARNINYLKELCNEELLWYNRSSDEALKLMLRSTLLSQLPITYQNVIIKFYEAFLRLEDGTSEEQCIICMQSRNFCNCTSLFQETNKKLKEMSLLEPLVGQSLTNLIYNYIMDHIQKVCKEGFDVSYISALESWLQTVIISWLEQIYLQDTNLNTSTNSLDTLNKKLVNYLYNTYTRTLIEQLFNIIIDYPESLPALRDLKLCLHKTDLMPYLIRTLQKAMQNRLLHPGVSTCDVLTAYVAAIKSLRILDPSGLILGSVTQPVHQYLRSREDTVRCVVNSLTEEGPGDLAEELTKGEIVHVDESHIDDEDMELWQSWKPDPATSGYEPSSNKKRTSDIISMLVNVYGSKDLFVNEYRTLLADRLLTHFTCDTEKEIRYLELLKLRFGDSQLHYCEVMLKDIADSKRINQNIKQDANYDANDIPLTAIILSAQFWPSFKDEKLELHGKLKERIETYTQAFETLKGSRTLNWKHHLGTVDLEIEFGDRVLNLAVSPVHATILMHFQDKNVWSLDDLSHTIHIPSTILRRKLGFWQSHGVIVEDEPNIFHLQEEQKSDEDNGNDDIIIEDSESESAMASAQDQREEELQTFWSYIVGMLMNLDALPLERIHQMLKMFAFQGPSVECSIQELKAFLDRKVREHQLIYSNGVYRLPK